MKTALFSRFAAALAVLSFSALAGAETIYRCVDPRGVTTISNTRIDKHCEVIARGTEIRGAAPAALPARPAATPSPAEFPKVSGDTQKSRDMDRRFILHQELAAEQRNLDLARRDPAGRERAAQHERNIQAIQKELSGMR